MESLRPDAQASCRVLFPVVVGTFVALMLGVLGYAHFQVMRAETFADEMRAVSVVAPEGRPEVSQESIDLAIVMYGILVPSSSEHPTLDPKLSDRGLTTRATFLEKAIVTVGPAAFESWGLLGSTLAHELEIHCQQNFLAIYLMDAIGLDGTGAAERQAYVHELRNADRFGLGGADADLIADTMEFFYPDTGVSRISMPGTIRNWLARNVLHGQPRL